MLSIVSRIDAGSRWRHALLPLRQRVLRSTGAARFRLLSRMRRSRSRRRDRPPRPDDRPGKPQIRLYLFGTGSEDAAPTPARRLGENTAAGNRRPTDRPCRDAPPAATPALRVRRLGVQTRQAGVPAE